MTEQRYLNQIFSIRGRFHRSANLLRDWQKQNGLGEYVLTPTADEAVQKIVTGIVSKKDQKVWAITGPYGTGKSSFVLFVSDLLCNILPKHPDAVKIREDYLVESGVFVPVLVMGHRSSLKHALLGALRDQVATLLSDLAANISQSLLNDLIDDSTVVKLYEAAYCQVKEKGYKGIFLVIDEFGKFLEFAAQHPDTEDLFVLQELAEMGSRAEGSFIFLTVLHSSFDGYLPILDETRRVEWKKIQGRFTDIPFLEPPEQFLSLVTEAISRNGTDAHLLGKYQEKIIETVNSKAMSEANLRYPLGKLLLGTVPLDPFAALLLWPLFRSKLAQNERSLFAFLMDYGPFGFQEYLSITLADNKRLQFYRLDRLYDYVSISLGSATLLGEQTKRWGEIEHALDRIPSNAPEYAKSVVKAIGLLGMYGSVVGLSASEETLCLAFDKSESVKEALTYLDLQSVVVYRRFTGAYALWEGSDVDLDMLYKEAQSYVGHGNLSERLKKAITLRPFVARAHYIQKGTLRYFDVNIIDGSNEKLNIVLESGIGESDGRLVFVLSSDQNAREKYVSKAQELTEQNQQFVFAFPKPLVGLEQLLVEIETWTWIKANAQSLQGDPVAKKEVDIHISNASKLILDKAGQIFGIRGYVFDPGQSEWVHGGKISNIPTAIRFQQWLSELCDQIYLESPILHNELLNREHLSPAASAARRNLIEAMVDREDVESLGITGTPAEMSMYRSMLLEGGFHTFRNNSWQLSMPRDNWKSVWNVMEAFLESARENRRPIVELINLLKEPPIGMREGPIFVLLTCLVLLHKEYIALYEEGFFISDLRVEVFERLTRVPGIFEFQLYQLSGRTREAVSAVNQALDVLHLSNPKEDPQLIDVVKPLVSFAVQLPDYTKKTKRFDFVNATKVRDALLRTGDPYQLLFDDLPSALDLKLEDEEGIELFVTQLKNCILALQSAYPSLLNEIEAQIRDVFGLSGTSADVRHALRKRAEPLVSWAIDRTITPFIRAAAANNDAQDWREVLARAISQGRPPHIWLDYDTTRFQIHLRQIAGEFVRIEELVAERNGGGDVRIIRIGILDGPIQERRAVVSVSPENVKAVDFFVEKINEALDGTNIQEGDAIRVRLAALAKVIENYLPSEEVHHG